MIASLLPNYIIKYRRLIKYFIAGTTAASVDLSLIYFFTDILGIWYLLSACLAFVVAFFVSFFLQKFWTFRDTDKEAIYKQMGVYLAVALANLMINAGLMYILVDGFKVWYLLAQLIVGGLVACESYFVYKLLIFNKGNPLVKNERKPHLPKSAGIKILITTGVYPPAIGGPATYGFYLRAELLKLGCEIKIITFGEKNSDSFQENIFYISRTNNILIRYFKFFRASLRLADWADVIYTLDLMSAGLPATLAAALKKKKIIFRTGGDFLWEKAYQNVWTKLPLVRYYLAKKKFLEKFLMFFCRWLLSKIDLVIFSTEFQKKLYRDYYQVAEAKSRLIANALPEIKGPIQNFQPGQFIIFAGRLIKLKNLDRLIAAFSRIKSNDLKLVIFGQGPERKTLAALIKRLKLESRVEIHHQVEQGELIRLISGSRFFILPSITELSPNLALECLGLKKPIILTKETGLPKELTSRLVTIDPLSEDDIKNKIDYLMNDRNLVDYQNSLKQLKTRPRAWSELASEHFNIFRNLK